MKKSFFSFRVPALAAMAVLLQLSACNNKPAAPATVQSPATDGNSSGKIAYVNIDTLESNYTYLKNKREEMAARQRSMEAELQRSQQQFQNDLMAMQKKAQSGNMTQSEGEAAEKRLAQMQQSLEVRRVSLSEQLMKEQADFNKELRRNLDSFLAMYNKDKHFDYVLSYTENGAILYANKGLDITADVIKGLNEMTPARDTTK